ncbi:MAG TPA: type II toxin-antitoxin system RelE/ParE family toxin [Stellaceae bacterium]|nr:type II toxin-antitoxin system RelE/ParE family toxin [Stellaceae bacterium]
MRVRWLKTALRNLDKEASYIAQDDPAMARIVVDRIFRAVAGLADSPSIGRPGRVSGTRELIVPKTRNLIPYRIREDRIEILRVFRASRRPPERW